MDLIRTSHLNRYHRQTQDPLLKDVCLSLEAGDRLGLEGPSGSGKTLLLRAIAMLDEVDSGEVLWRGQPVLPADVPRFRSRVIYVPQRPTLVEGTVEQSLRQPLAFGVHREKPFNHDRLVRWLADLQRDPAFLDKPSDSLSGGETQLTALLRALQLDPEVLLLDEPTSAMDDPTARAVERLVLAWLAERDRAFIWVSHDQQQARRVTQRRLSMSAGRLRSADA